MDDTTMDDSASTTDMDDISSVAESLLAQIAHLRVDESAEMPQAKKAKTLTFHKATMQTDTETAKTQVPQKMGITDAQGNPVELSDSDDDSATQDSRYGTKI